MARRERKRASSVSYALTVASSLAMSVAVWLAPLALRRAMSSAVWLAPLALWWAMALALWLATSSAPWVAAAPALVADNRTATPNRSRDPRARPVGVRALI